MFHRIVAGQHDRIVSEVTRFNPHVLVHLAVWEPHARAAPDTARRLTDDAMISVLGAAAECRALESIILRSGIEVYGRRRGSVTRPSEDVALDPTCEWGRMLAEIEQTGGGDRRAGRRRRSAALRLAPILGPHIPSPLGRFLRMPAVPFSALADPPFAVSTSTTPPTPSSPPSGTVWQQPLNIVASGRGHGAAGDPPRAPAARSRCSGPTGRSPAGSPT